MAEVSGQHHRAGSPPTWPRCWPAEACRQAGPAPRGNGAGPGAAASSPAAAAGAGADSAAPAGPAWPVGPARGAEPARARLQQPAAGGHPHRGRPVRAYRRVSCWPSRTLARQSVSQIKHRLADRGLPPREPAARRRVGRRGGGPGRSRRHRNRGGRAPRAAAPARRRAAAARGGTGALGGRGGPARGARPPDEDAIDLLSVAGFPVLKRALPVLGAVVVLLLVVLGRRSRGRRRSPGT